MKNEKKSTRSRGPAPKRKGGPAAKKAKRPAGKKGRAARKGKPQRKPAAPARAAVAENPAARALAQKIARAVLDKKASNVVVMDVRGIASYADYVVVASGDSDRQVAAMAEGVQQKVKSEDGLNTIGSEGLETGQWVLLDYGDVVAHLFHAEVREHYDLEGLWADAPRETVA